LNQKFFYQKKERRLLVSKIKISEMTREELEIFARDLEMENAALRTENDYLRSK